MSAQTTLTQDAPMILDATCSTLKIWPKFASIRMDVRREVGPDIVADAKHLPFRCNIFQRIYCDPPHFIRPDTHWKPQKGKYFASVNRGTYPHEHFLNSMFRYGHFRTQEEWQEFVRSTNDEFQRCLKDNGVLEYKIADGKNGDMTKLSDLKEMTNFVLESSRKTLSPFGKTDIYWLTMKPKPRAPLTVLRD